MKTARAAAAIRWIARVWDSLTGLGLAALFLGYLCADVYNKLKGLPVSADGFFAQGTAAFFFRVLPTLAMVGLGIAGLALFWRREKLGVALALAGALSTWLFSSVMALADRAPEGAGDAHVFAEMLPLPALLAFPALLMILARWLERRARKGSA